MIIDASVLLRAYFPDEAQAKAQMVLRDHVAGRVMLKAPELLAYEVSNAIWQAERRDRITADQTAQIITSIEGLQIEIHTLEWGEMLPMARRFERSAYDAAYLTLAENLGEPIVTGDKRLFNTVQDQVDWVIWIEEYGDTKRDRSG